jgi:hypothetical protein
MAVTEYDTLVATTKVWCARSDSVFSAQIPNFIGMAEDRIYDGYGVPGEPAYSPPMRSVNMESTATVTMTNGVGPMPTDLLEPRKLYRPSDEVGITYIAPERYSVVNASAGAGVPAYYTIEAGSIKVTPSTVASLSLLYYKRFPAITSDNKNGTIIAAHGMIYLEAVLYEAFSFIQSVDLALAHATKCRSLIMGVNKSASTFRHGGPLRVRHRQPIP